MNSTVDTISLEPSYGWLEKLARKRVFGYLCDLEDSRLNVREQNQEFEFGYPDAQLSATIVVHDPRFYSMVALYGTIGAGEAFMAGYWDTDDLVKLIRIFARNIHQVQAMDGSAINVLRWLDVACSKFNTNSLRGSSRNISRHYDLGNDFFRLFLDAGMMYSSAIYSDEALTLESASENKLSEIGRKLQLGENDHLLEIGTGWGGLAVFMAGTYGCKVTTTTISNEQFQYAVNKVKKAGLENRITVLKRDYRQLSGEFDKLVSVEMIEAVGHKYLPAFFETCNKLVKPGGKMLLQAITIPEQRYRQAIRQIDFIQKYIFPGGCLPSVEIMLRHTGERTQFQLLDFHDITDSYAQTLTHWRERYTANISEVARQGYDKSFMRMWEFYFCYCEAGFTEKSIGTSQSLFERRQ